MASISESRLRSLVDRFEQVEARMGVASDPDEIVDLSRQHSSMKEAAEKARELLNLRVQMAEARAMIDDPGADREMAALAEEEVAEIKERIPDMESEMQILLLPKDADDEASAVLEVRAGTGGDEAALFAGDLYRMYQRYAQLQGWKVELVSASEGDAGGYKEIIASVTGNGVFGRLKFESGVHRVQRVPETESGGRIHTSAATVAVLPEAEAVDVDIPAADIRIDTMRASGAGGQHVNTTDSAVRITHIPSGIVVVSSEKSQHRNRELAMQVLRTRLFDLERQRVDSERSADRKAQVGSGDRSERIRTYNFPQGRCTDHRINLTLYSLDRVMQGELGEIVDALIADDQARKLAEVQG